MPRVARHSPNQQRTLTLECAVSATERDVIRAHAAAAGQSASEYMRTRALRAPISHRLDAQTLADATRALGLLTAEIQRLGNNLNQIAKHTNTARQADSFAVVQARRLIDQALAQTADAAAALIAAARRPTGQDGEN